MAETLRVKEAADRLGVSTQTVRRYIERGRLSGFQVTPGVARSPWRVTLESIEEFEEERKRQQDQT